MNYTEARALKTQFENAAIETGKAIRPKMVELGQRLGLQFFQHENGLTVEAIRLHPEFVAVKKAYELAHKELQGFNKAFLKQFKKEYNAELKANRK